jgi:hypothetical protein
MVLALCAAATFATGCARGRAHVQDPFRGWTPIHGEDAEDEYDYSSWVWLRSGEGVVFPDRWLEPPPPVPDDFPTHALGQLPPHARYPKEFAGPLGRSDCVIRVADGWLVAFNRGEWEGEVWHLGEDAATWSKVSDDQVIEFLPCRGGLFAVGGLAHLEISEGFLCRFHRSADGSWRSETLADLGSEPIGSEILPDGRILVLTRSRWIPRSAQSPGEDRAREPGRLLLFDERGKKTVLWAPLSRWPCSLAVDGHGVIHIGTVGRLVRLTPLPDGGYREEVLAAPRRPP